jgi:hypothetical protein
MLLTLNCFVSQSTCKVIKKDSVLSTSPGDEKITYMVLAIVFFLLDTTQKWLLIDKLMDLKTFDTNYLK